jgi:hypothetical protein
MTTPRALALAFGLGTLAAACGPSAGFACTDRSECERGGELGWCEAGYCAFLDPGCVSMHRWGEHAPSDIAGACVPWDPEDPDALPSDDGKGALDDAPPDPEDDTGETTGGDAMPSPTDGEPEPEPEPAPEPGWICATEDLYALDDDLFDGMLPGGWTLGASESASALILRTEDETTLHLDAGAPASLWIERELHVGSDAIAQVSGVDLVGLEARGFLELVTDVPHRIEYAGARIVLVSGDEPDPILDMPIDPSLASHLRIVVGADAIRWEASSDGASFVELAWRPRSSDASPTHVSIGVERQVQSPVSAELVFETISTCTPV